MSVFHRIILFKKLDGEPDSLAYYRARRELSHYKEITVNFDQTFKLEDRENFIGVSVLGYSQQLMSRYSSIDIEVHAAGSSMLEHNSQRVYFDRV